MKRKTIDVLLLVQWANEMLSRTDEFATVDFKAGVCTIIEDVLLHTKNYKGFMFIDNNDTFCGTLGYYSRMYFYEVTK